MSQCPFLTTPQEKVQCFNECALFNWPENDGICPFKNLTHHKSFNIKELYDYSAYDESHDSFYGSTEDEEFI